jgi:REP element-mobilizing transposase RayT
MARTQRFVISDEQAVYHVMSRTALAGFPLGDVEKDYLLGIIKKLSRLYFAEVIGFCIMGNHFHLLVKMFPETEFSNKQIKQRFVEFYGEERKFSRGHIPFYRQKWSSLSEFIKEIKQSFSRFYNKQNGRKGFFWGERFKSVIVENGDTLVNCLAYIDLNPVRAGIVEKPEQYRWCGLGYHVQGRNRDAFLSLDLGLRQFGDMTDRQRLRKYREYVYETGAMEKDKGSGIKEKTFEKEKKKGFKLTRADRFAYRTRYFTDSGIIGSKEFVQVSMKRFERIINAKRERLPKRVGGLDGVYSLKRLS